MIFPTCPSLYPWSCDSSARLTGSRKSLICRLGDMNHVWGKLTYLRTMDQLLQQIEQYKQEIAAIVPNGADALEAYRIKFLGTKGIVKGLFTEMKNVPNDQKKEFGAILNEFKQLAESKYEDWKSRLDPGAAGPGRSIDLSLPGDALPLGTHHPIT